MNAKKALLLKRKRVAQQLPPLEEVVRGSLLKRSIRCGKPSCRCAEGEGHQTFYLTVSFARGRTEQVTIPPPLVPTVRRWLANYQQLWLVLEDISAVNRELLRKRWLEAEPEKSGGRT
jgi:hypothetical protein